MSKKSNQPVGAVDPVAVVVCPPAFPVSGILSTGKCNIISKITLLDWMLPWVEFWIPLHTKCKLLFVWDVRVI